MHLPFKKIFLFSIIFGTLAVVYSPALLIPYAYHDGYLFWYRNPADFPLHFVHKFNFCAGRFLGAYIFTILGWLVKNVPDLNLIRLINLFQLSLCGYLCLPVIRRYCSGTLNKQHEPRASARGSIAVLARGPGHGQVAPDRASLDPFLFVIMIFTLPSFQVLVAWEGLAFIMPAVLLAAASAIRADKIPTEGRLTARIINKYFLSAFLLLLCAFTVYPSAATFYWAVVALIIVSLEAGPFKMFYKKTANLFLTGLAAMGAYALLLSAAKKSCLQFPLGLGERNPYVISTDIISGLKWFMQEPLPNALNLWEIYPQKMITFILAGFILSAGVLRIVRVLAGRCGDITQKENFKKTLLLICLAGGLVFLSFLPNLAATYKVASYRCLAGLSALMLVFLLWALREWLPLLALSHQKTIFSFVLAVCCLFAINSAHGNILYRIAWPNHLELEYVKQVIGNSDMRRYQYVYFVPVQRNLFRPRYDEFANLSTFYESPLPPMVICVLNELHIEERFQDKPLSIIYNISPERLREDRSIFVIDTNRLADIVRRIHDQY